MEAEKLNEISVGKLLLKLNIPQIKEIRKIGKDRVKVTLLCKKAANRIISNPNIFKIKTFIPNNYIKSTGIIKNVPLDLTEDEYYESAVVHGNVKINKIERMTYFDKEEKIAKF